MFDGNAALEMADYYKPLTQERRGDTLNARVPKRLKDQLLLLAAIWTEKERIRQKDKLAEATVGDAVVRLLAVGLQGAWAEAGISVDDVGDPSEAEAEALLKNLREQAKSIAG